MADTVERTDPSALRRARRRRSSIGVRVLTVIGILLLIFGLGCFGYVGFQLFGTNAASQQSYKSERVRLKQQWNGGGKGSSSGQKSAVVPGNAIALLSIPSVGLKEVPVLEGTDDDVLARGIGHYAKTADPGKVGNFAVAGHRITHGEPFAHLLELKKGDQVVVETRSAVYTYEIGTSPRKLTVNDTEGWVLDPVPGTEGADPTEALITLTTCQDLFHSSDRSVGFGALVDTKPK